MVIPVWTLVVVEDDKHLCGAIAEFAREELPVREVRETTSVEAACSAIESVPPEEGARLVVISDYNLKHPSRSGLDVLALARQKHPDSKRVLMSGEDPDSMPRRWQEEGVHAFLEKPFRFDRIGAIVGTKG